MLWWCTHEEAGHVEVVAGHVHENASAVLKVRYRRRGGIAAGDVDSPHITYRARVNLVVKIEGSALGFVV